MSSTTTTIVNTPVSDVSTSTLTNKSIDADDNTITDIDNNEIKAAAAIALNKLAATTVSRALVSDSSGFIAAATTTATEMGYLNGVTSAIQTQLNALVAPAICNERITLTSGSPFASSATTALTGTTLYVTPYRGNKIGLYNGSTWDLISFSETSFAVPSTTNTMYDLFAYNNSGTLALEATAWTNDTTRATAITLQDGIEVKSGTLTRRYLGSFRTNGTTGTVSMDNTGYYIWNRYNKQNVNGQIAYVTNGGTNYTITSNIGTRQIGGVTTYNSIPYIVGLAEEDYLYASLTGFGLDTSAVTGTYVMGFGNNSTSTIQVASTSHAVVPTTTSTTTSYIPLNTTHTIRLSTVGLRTLYALENCNRSAGTFTVTYSVPNFNSGTLKISLPM